MPTDWPTPRWTTPRRADALRKTAKTAGTAERCYSLRPLRAQRFLEDAARRLQPSDVRRIAAAIRPAPLPSRRYEQNRSGLADVQNAAEWMLASGTPADNN